MQEASFSGLIRSIFYIVAFYYIFKFVFKLLFPIVMKKVVNKATENFQQQYSQQYRQDSSWQKKQSSKDEVISKTANAKYPHETKKVGEYVDYEEID